MAECAGAQEIVESQEHDFRVETFAEGFGLPWGMAFLPDGRLLVTEREGVLRVVGKDGRVSVPIEGVPEVRAEGQGGLMDVALHPQYAQNGWIYLSFSDPLRGPIGGTLGYTAIARGKLRGKRLVSVEVIYRVPERFYSPHSHHYGARIAFDRESYLYFAIGDRGQRPLAQNVELPNGKVHRLYDDGRVPEDNPFVGQKDAIESIWSYGHRNPQGLALHPGTGQLWGAEHGPKGGDELNHVRKGLNYGWPVITFGINYDGSPITDKTEAEGMEQPQTYWLPSIAVCGIDFYTGEGFGQWQHDLLVTSLKFNRLHRVRMEGAEVVHEEIVYEGESRVRDVQTGPDGAVYLAVEEPGRILRLVPEK
ncbi:MAG: PQQ-dependent sugar dehydrogenase [Candidatus Latescibacterota bacterium]|nr:PQQ-dependent sugar dehydrogenase [Candidatus Latescibacterota bacterium]